DKVDVCGQTCAGIAVGDDDLTDRIGETSGTMGVAQTCDRLPDRRPRPCDQTTKQPTPPGPAAGRVLELGGAEVGADLGGQIGDVDRAGGVDAADRAEGQGLGGAAPELPVGLVGQGGAVHPVPVGGAAVVPAAGQL